MSNNVDEQRPINTDPREHGYYQPYSPQEPSLRQKSRRAIVLTLVLILVFLAIAGAALNFWNLLDPGQTTALPVHTFHVAGHTQLIVHNTSGDIRIHEGESDSIVVHGTKYVSGFGANMNDITVDYQQNGNTVSVTANEGSNFLGERGVDLDISVPPAIDLQIENRSGDIGIEHVSGDIEAQTTSGDINASNLQGTLRLSTTSGDVTLDASNGTMALSAISGDVKAHHTQLHGQSSMTSTSGEVAFDGSLDPQGSYRMQAVSGDVDLKLPSNRVR